MHSNARCESAGATADVRPRTLLATCIKVWQAPSLAFETPHITAGTKVETRRLARC